MGKPRYKELKFEGKTYTEKYQIDEILLDNKLNWFLDCEIENVRFEIMKETLIINGGIFYNGVFEYGVIRDIDCRNITFQNGVIYNGVFKRIKMMKGIIFDGTFIKGDILFADIRGGEFKDVNISDNVNKTQKETQPSLLEPEKVQPQGEPTQKEAQSQPQVQVQGEIQGQEGQNIQSQVQEKRIVKTFESFMDFFKSDSPDDIFIKKLITNYTKGDTPSLDIILFDSVSFSKPEWIVKIDDKEYNISRKVFIEFENLLDKLRINYGYNTMFGIKYKNIKY